SPESDRGWRENPFEYLSVTSAKRFQLRLGRSLIGLAGRRSLGIVGQSRGFAKRRMLAMACSRLNASIQGGHTLENRRCNFLLLAGVAASASAMPKVARAQVPAGPKLTQIVRKDLEGQDRQVQESVVSLAEFGPGTAAPWHVHPGAQEILYTIEGNLVVEIE